MCHNLVYIGAMARTNTRLTFTLAFSQPDRHDGAAVIAADAIDDAWLLFLAFYVAAGRTDLIGHLVAPVADWHTCSDDERTERLLRVGRAVTGGQHVGDIGHLTARTVRAATATGIEQKVRENITKYAARAWGGAVLSGKAHKVGPRSAGDLRRAEVARRYVELLTSPTPKATLAAELNLSINTVNSLLYQARDRGLLTSAGQGRAGGRLTPKATEILEGAS